LIRTSLFILAIGVAASSASAMPLIQTSAVVHADNNVVNVKIICEQDGHCYQEGRRPVARWVYGEDVFYGFGPFPYNGPHYYGKPGKHWAPWAFLKFWD
jgi:hypothetical protein